MMVWGSVLRAITIVVVLMLFCPPVEAQVTCIQTYLSASNTRSLGFAPSVAEDLVNKAAVAIGQSPSGIRIIPCDGVDKVQSIYYHRPEVPKGDYIVYD